MRIKSFDGRTLSNPVCAFHDPWAQDWPLADDLAGWDSLRQYLTPREMTDLRYYRSWHKRDAEWIRADFAWKGTWKGTRIERLIEQDISNCIERRNKKWLLKCPRSFHAFKTPKHKRTNRGRAYK